MNLSKKILWYSIVLITVVMHSQEVPPIQIFSPQDYGAEDQNWAVTQSQNEFIYVANNKGLLEYDGATWRIYDSPNDGILRSVRVVGDRIYSGGYRDFGFWTKDNFGELQYKSLTQSKEFTVKEDEEFWGIIDIEGYVLFQSFERIYIYNTIDESFKIIDSEIRINKIFKVGETIYFQKSNLGVFRIESGQEVLHISSNLIGNKEVINIYSNREGGLLLQTREKGFYTYKNNEIYKWNIASDSILSKVSIYSSARLKNGNFILGSISNGIIQLDSEGELLLTINQSRGLSNNTVLSVKEDSYGNVWLALDNGINVLNLNSPFLEYKDKQGVLGTVYTSAKTEAYIYLGTNQGLFYKDLNFDSKFKFIDGTEGQVWSLQVLKGLLFCGHDTGTFIINNNRAEKIASEKGTWGIKGIEGNPNLLIQSNYKGFSILEKTSDNKWKYRNKVKGFDISSRYFEFSNANEILVSHEHKGVYKIEIDSAFQNVLRYEKIVVDEGIKSSIYSYNGSLMYSYEDGVFYFDRDSSTFKKDSLLSTFFEGEKYVSGKMISDDENNRLWGFNNSEIIYVEPGKLSGSPEVNVIAISSEMRKTKAGYENVLHLDGSNYLIGTTDGYLIINIDKLEYNSYDISLNNSSYNSLRNEVVSLDLTEPAQLKNKDNSVWFKYSVTNFNKLISSKYQYRLKGIYDDWSDWSTSSEVFFENLPFGDYTFEARAMTAGIISNNTISYPFTIGKPWYLKPLAVALYFMLAIVLAYMVHFFNKRHYKKQEQDLIRRKEREIELEQSENQRQLMQFKNENLQLDIENKNRELGIATMNLVKRNELLNNIKDELANTKSMTEVKRVIKFINSSLNDSNDWKLFEEAFNNVDKDFMKRIKALHPSITPNDLRLCAYLRLNLSSKEIAPLLNISHKSVEVKRYRLRKKMGLDHDQSLSNYIIEL
jgi:DNA-binding CsgD family transcriptional regulator/membrane protein implicated in regulation of membrane protease activity